MHIIQSGVKIAAVLGIALITVLLIAATLYLLLGVRLSEEEGAVTPPPPATREIPSNALEPDTLAASEQSAQPQSQDPDLEGSRSTSESLSARSDPATSEPDPSISTPNQSNESPPRLTRDSTSNANASANLVERSAPEATRLSSTPPNISSDGATAEASLPTQSVSEPADTRYYTIKEGDTLYSIARQVYGAGKYWKLIYDTNGNLIKDPVKLKLGWKLELPPLDKAPSGN